MPTEAVEPTPKWMDTPFHGHYRKHFLGSKVPRALTVLTFFGFMASFVAYADRRCLYIYQVNMTYVFN